MTNLLIPYTESVDALPGWHLPNQQMLLLAGPCVAESEMLCVDVASQLKEICKELSIKLVFKASFDKANRTSAQSIRGQGIEEGLRILEAVKNQVQVPVVTDVHESSQVNEVAHIVDVIQIPAFLCRQTDLLLAAGETGKAVNIKKGQFMAPEDMQFAVNKVQQTGNKKVLLTERGATFGYHNLVVDMRSLPIMRQFAPTLFDVTHSVQMPGGEKGKSGGKREFAPFLARAAAACGVDGFFIETHPKPDEAWSDGPNMIPLNQMKAFLSQLLEIQQCFKNL